MDLETIFLLGVYLLPLALLSLVKAWTDERRPVVALLLGAGATACFAYVARIREDGLFSLREIPELTFALAARLIALF